MARPRADAHAEPTVDRVLVAAEEAFAQSGFGGARLADIAKAAGIRRPSLLYHFGSKERLYAAVVERTFARLGEALASAMALEGEFPSRVDALVGEYLDFLKGNPHFAPLVLREILDGQGPGRELIQAQVGPLLDSLDLFVEEGIGQVRPGPHLRSALMQIATSLLVRSASGPVLSSLWGEGEHTPALARLILLEE